MTGGSPPLTCAACSRAIVARQVAIFREGRAYHLPCYRHTGVLTIVAGRERRARAGGAHPDAGRDRHHAARAPAAPGRDRPLPGARILLVQPGGEERDRLAARLRRAGATVLPVPDADQALAAFAAGPPDVVIAALAPPDAALAVLRRIRGLGAERGGRVPVLAVTPAGDAEACRRARAAGFTACLAGPLDGDQLLDVLRRTLGRAASP